MRRMDSATKADQGTFLGTDDVLGKLEFLTRTKLGMGAAEFAKAYPRGQLARVPIAADIAALLPFAGLSPRRRR